MSADSLTTEGLDRERSLSQLLLLQGTLHVMPTVAGLTEFAERAAQSIPGVASMHICTAGRPRSPGASFAAICDACGIGKAASEAVVKAPCGLKNGGLLRSLGLRTQLGSYGAMTLVLDDESRFRPYAQHVENLANVLAIHIENSAYKKQIEAANRDLTVEVAERKRIELALREEKYFAESLVQTAQAIVLVLNPEGRIISFNPYMESISGYSIEEVRGRDWFSLFLPEPIRNQIRDVFKNAIADIQTRGRVDKIVTKDGREIDIEWHDKTLKDEAGSVIGLLAIGQDVTERKRTGDRIAALLREKEILLKEVHHRIKNNMSSMISLLSLQAAALKNSEAAAALQEAKGRMRSMAVLYDKLYRSENLREMSLRTYLPPLIEEIAAVFPNQDSVKIEMKIDDIVLGVRALSPLGIIVNELLTNAMRHAFSGRDAGSIIVSASAKNGRVTLVIEDDGSGVPESVDLTNPGGFGLQLVGLLTAQLDGTLQIERRKGTRFVLEFGI
jgi:PAS domain S-box-containing protein